MTDRLEAFLTEAAAGGLPDGELARRAQPFLASADGDDRSRIHQALGLAARSGPEPGRAADHLRRAVEAAASPERRAVARLHLGGALIVTGDAAGAVEVGERAEADLPVELRPRLWCNLGTALGRLGRTEEALGRLDAAVDAAREQGDDDALVVALNNRAELWEGIGRAEAAEIDLRTIVAESPRAAYRAAARHNVGLLLVRRGALRAGLQDLARARPDLETELGAGIPAALDEAAALLACRSLDEAGELVEELLADPGVAGERPDVERIGARVAVASGRLTEAAQRFRAAASGFTAQGRSADAAEADRLARLADGGAGDDVEAGRDAAPTAPGEREILLHRALGATGAERREWLDRAASPTGDDWVERALGARAELEGALDAGRPEEAADALDRALAIAGDAAAEFESFEARWRCLEGAAPLPDLAARVAVALGDGSRLRGWHDRMLVLTAGDHRAAIGSEVQDGLSALRAVEGSANSEERRLLERRIRARARLVDPTHGVVRPATLDAHHRVTLARAEDRLVAVVGDSADLVDLGVLEEVADALRKVRFAASLVARSVPEPGPREVATVRRAAERAERMHLGPLLERLDDDVVVEGQVAAAAVPWRLLPGLRHRRLQVRQTARFPGGPTRAPSSVAVVVGPDLDVTGERDAVARSFPGATVRLASTVDEALDVLETCDLVHVAAHGTLRHDDPLLSSLRLVDGDLTVYDLELLTTAPTTVVLASCRIGGTRQGSLAWGLGTVLCARGTRHVVASPLALADRHLGPVMAEWYRLVALGADAPTALARLEIDDPYAAVAADSLITLG